MSIGQFGESGVSGESGDSGNSGESGESGVSGNSGESGESGEFGDSGESGHSGTRDKLSAEHHGRKRGNRLIEHLKCFPEMLFCFGQTNQPIWRNRPNPFLELG